LRAPGSGTVSRASPAIPLHTCCTARCPPARRCAPLQHAWGDGRHPRQAEQARAAARHLRDIQLRYATLLDRLGPALGGPGTLADADAWYFILEGTREPSVAEAQAMAITELAARAATALDGEPRAILLARDPQRAPVVQQIFTWRVVHKLGMPTIAVRLNADPARYPAPTGKGWTTPTVYAILGNPKYTGHMVYGRIRKRNGRRVTVPPAEWPWSPEPVHPAIIDRPTWEAAQEISAEHSTSRDGDQLSRHPAATRTYAYRGRCRCRDCRRRMGASPYPSAAGTRVYYQCPHNPANPRHAAAAPDHPRTVKAPETRLDQIVGLFFTDHIFGPRRAELLAAQLPATDAAARADRDASAAAIRTRLRQIETAQNSCILELEQLPADSADTAAAAMRGRIRARFADLHAEREQLDAQLAALAAATPRAADPTLLDELPLAGDILPGLPPDLKTRLLDAFDIQVLWNKPGRQATVHAEITDATLQALPAILNPGQDDYDDTSEQSSGDPDSGEDLFEAPIGHRINRITRINHDLSRAVYLTLHLRTIDIIARVVSASPSHLDREGGAEPGQGAVAVAVGRPGFQADGAGVAHLVQGGGHGRVVDLAGAGLAPAGHVGHLDLADQRPGPPD
jgi:Recombinase